ncbi:MAG: M24 family metallopeptidase, partial [Chloroflexales bacterium]|nr:M24 family metallopeptidase [Chloroflexales bacterium]
PAAALLFTDGRYTLRAAREAPAFTLRQVVNPGRPFPDLLREAAAELGLARVAFEAAHTTVAEYQSLAAAMGDAVALDPVEGVVEPLRELKDTEELATLRRAIAITDAAFTAVAERLTPETTERQAAWMLEVAMRVGGADALSFPSIVAAGPNAAQPHATPGDEPLGSGRPIIIDMGARVGGYHADLTRTIILGEPEARFRQIYALVAEAQRRAIAGLRPGLPAHEADALARDYIAAAGYGEQFGHGLGHGVGLDIHEWPQLRRALPGAGSAPLRPGMVTSVEPGIYLEGWGGVRIEDLALITEGGSEVLSRAPRLANM